MLLLLAGYYAYDQWQLGRNGVVAVGEVVDLRTIKRSKFATVRFQAPDGRSYTISEHASVPMTTQQGDRIEVIFHPAHLGQARVASSRWAGVHLLLFFAFMLGFIITLFTRRSRRTLS